MKNVHDYIVKELFEYKSLAAFIYLIDAGREAELTYDQTSAFISKDGSKKQSSVWIGQTEQAFENTEELLEHAIIQGRRIMDIWEQIEIETLY